MRKIPKSLLIRRKKPFRLTIIFLNFLSDINTYTSFLITLNFCRVIACHNSSYNAFVKFNNSVSENLISLYLYN